MPLSSGMSMSMISTSGCSDSASSMACWPVVASPTTSMPGKSPRVRRSGSPSRTRRPPTGKVERWHQSLQLELLNVAGPFASVEDARATVEVWREEYNHRRPHQSLDMACPAGRFRPTPADDGLELWAPPDLEPVTAPAASTPDHPVTVEPVQ